MCKESGHLFTWWLPSCPASLERGLAKAPALFQMVTKEVGQGGRRGHVGGLWQTAGLASPKALLALPWSRTPCLCSWYCCPTPPTQGLHIAHPSAWPCWLVLYVLPYLKTRPAPRSARLSGHDSSWALPRQCRPWGCHQPRPTGGSEEARENLLVHCCSKTAGNRARDPRPCLCPVPPTHTQLLRYLWGVQLAPQSYPTAHER